jgi:hypothetical protein
MLLYLRVLTPRHLPLVVTIADKNLWNTPPIRPIKPLDFIGDVFTDHVLN